MAKKLTFQGLMLAAYVVLSLAISPIAFGLVQARISTGMYAMAYVFPELIWPLTLGNVIVNLNSPFGVVDWIVGALCGLTVTYTVSKLKDKRLVPLPIIIIPTVFVSVMLHNVIHVPLWQTILYVGIGQAISGIIFGFLFLKIAERIKQ